MGLKLRVPDPTEDDMRLAEIGFEVWYEHDSVLASGVGRPEYWKQEVLSLIRLANHYREIAEKKGVNYDK